jgi:lysyl-tRNA synthetase, class II
MKENAQSRAPKDASAPGGAVAARSRPVYKSKYAVTHLATEARELPDEAPCSVAGRVVLFRKFGGLIFGHIQDRSGRVQFSLDRADHSPERFAALPREVSLGDFVGLSGKMWTTNKGERTVRVEHFEVLSRAVRAMPDKWAGVADVEVKLRRRYLDLLTDEQTRNRFIVKSRMYAFIRDFLTNRGFLEVETPILQPSASGASARPFVTHHNALDADFYLRVSPETYLKRLVAGSFERVFELGRNFRNEGIDASHLQEFSMLEWYVAYWDYRDNMELIRELVQGIVREFCGSLRIEYQGVALDFGGDWPEVDYRTAVLERTGIDLREVRDLESLRGAIRTRGLEVDQESQVSYGGLVDLLYKKAVRPHLIQPMFLLHHPVELVPLARRSDEDPSRLDMFQVVVNSWEIVKAYSELIDPADQRARLEEQEALRSSGDDESMMLEEDFLECMEFGMPPMSGLGLGLDRLAALITNSRTLREIVLFPQLRW